MRLTLENVRLFDPGRGIDQAGATVSIADGRIVSLESVRDFAPDRVIDGHGHLLCPGLVDLGTQLCEPGFQKRETIETGTAAAARGGYTTVVALPTTEPCIDRVEVVEYIAARAREAGRTRVWPAGTLSVGREQKRLSEMRKLFDAGCVAFTDGDRTISDGQLLRYAMEAARPLDCPVITHPDDATLSLGGVMHEGEMQARLGLSGVPAAAEAVGVARDLTIAALTGARLHLAHVSTAESVDLIRQAKRRGVRVTAAVSPLHLWFTDASVGEYDTRMKIFPPLRPAPDVDAVLLGLADGTIDAVVSDHTPQTALDKNMEFDRAAPGAIGLETTLGVVLSRVREGRLTLERAMATLTRGPAHVLGRPDCGRIELGGRADLVLIDPAAAWKVVGAELRSRSENTPLLGQALTGRVLLTIAGGEISYEDQR